MSSNTREDCILCQEQQDISGKSNTNKPCNLVRKNQTLFMIGYSVDILHIKKREQNMMKK